MYTFLQLHHFERIVLSYHIVFTEGVDKVPADHETSRVSSTQRPQVLVAKDILLAGSICHLEAMIQVGTCYQKEQDAIYTFVDFPAVCCFLRRYTCTWTVQTKNDWLTWSKSRFDHPKTIWPWEYHSCNRWCTSNLFFFPCKGLNLGMSHVPSHNWHFWIFVCLCNDFYHNHLRLKKHRLPKTGITNPWTLACVQTNPWILRFSKIEVNPGDHRLKYTSTPQNQIAHYINYAYFLVNTQLKASHGKIQWNSSHVEQPHPTNHNQSVPYTFGGPRLSLACRRTSSWTNPWHLVYLLRFGIWTPKNTPNLRRYLDV